MNEDLPPYGSKYPKTIEETINRLFIEAPLKDQVRINSMDQDELINLHFSLGQYIRNEYGLWKGNDPLFDQCRVLAGNKGLDADSASMIIITEFWKRLREKPVMRVIK